MPQSKLLPQMSHPETLQRVTGKAGRHQVNGIHNISQSDLHHVPVLM